LRSEILKAIHKQNKPKTKYKKLMANEHATSHQICCHLHQPQALTNQSRENEKHIKRWGKKAQGLGLVTRRVEWVNRSMVIGRNS